MGETTLILKRRLRHWKTTLAGVATLFGPVALAIWPEHATKITQVCLALIGTGLIAGADAKPSEKSEVPK